MARKPGGLEGAGATQVVEAAEPNREHWPESLVTGVEFPFQVFLEHGPVDHRAMFRITETLDYYEVVGIKGENRGKPRRPLTIDVVEVTRDRTVLHITPGSTIPYPQMSAEIDLILSGANEKLYGGTARVAKIEWRVGKTGIASDLRGRLRPVM